MKDKICINEYVIDDICEELMLVTENSFHSETPLLRQIRESQEIVDGYYPIIEEIYEALLKVEKLPYDTDYSYLIYRLNNYQMKQDCFLKTVNVNVLAGKKGYKYRGGYFERDYDNIELSNDLKLLNAKFTIGISGNELNTKESKDAFFGKMVHELHHAFRYYNICISNNASIENAKISSARYGNLLDVMSNGSNDVDMKFLSPNLYMLDKNEIISEANELYEFIRQHEEINPSNFTKILNELPLFWRISRASKFIKYLDNILFNEKNKEKINDIGNAYIKLMNFTNTTPHKAFLKCRYSVLGLEEYIRYVFFRTVQKAFDDFGRKKEMYSIDIKEYIQKQEHLEYLNEILNETL